MDIKKALCLAAVSLLALAAVTSCVTTGGPEDVAKLAKRMDDYGRFLEEGDVESWLALSAKDVIKMPAEAPVKGYDKMEEDIRAKLEKVEFLSFKCYNHETVISGDYGWNRGDYKVQVKVRATGAMPPPTDGKYLTIFRREPDGSWKIIRDCYNSNIPLDN